MDWQVWIQDGPMPVIRKAVLASEEADGPAQLTYLFSGWDLTMALPDFVFEFTPPPGVAKIEILAVPTGETAVPAAPEPQSSK